MGHNFVVLTPGTDKSDFGTAAFGAKDNDYIPASYAASIVVHTKLLGPGESDTVKFQIDEPGVYEFICSFPGHAALMNGTEIGLNRWGYLEADPDTGRTSP